MSTVGYGIWTATDSTFVKTRCEQLLDAQTFCAQPTPFQILQYSSTVVAVLRVRVLCLHSPATGLTPPPRSPLILAWMMANARSDQERALRGAAIGGLRALGSVISPWTYRASPSRCA